MKRIVKGVIGVLLVATWVICVPTALAQVGSAFTYQGQLVQSGEPANGSYDFQFLLYSQESGGTPWVGNTQERTLVVTDGIFTTELDFPAEPFTGANRWLGDGLA